MLLFVYGTLGTEYENEGSRCLAAAARRLGPASMPGTMFRVGAYPGVVDPLDPTALVHGEVYEAEDDAAEGLLAFLDQYEGVRPPAPEPPLFRRVQRRIVLGTGGVRDAWVYLYARPTLGLPVIPSGRFPGLRRNNS